ncbi:helix-turn-helix transcriptional regulator [Oceanobacillus kapialis]|uniref:helix-turn-helix transcriptional regulator n=1 Tax=Oceanobacillus kapialis TaxID=481353 RepID=UPI00384C0197
MGLEKIAINIKHFRIQNEWTQQELADRLSISRSVVAKWENRTAVPDVGALLKLASLFQLSLDHLTSSPAYEEEMLKDFKRIYGKKKPELDSDLYKQVEYLRTHPEIRALLSRIEALPEKKQLSIQKVLGAMLDQYEQL